MTQGDSFIEKLLMEDSEGNQLALVGYQFRSQIRRTPLDRVAAEFQISVSGSTVTRSLLPSVTAQLEGIYVHDFQWINPQGETRTLLAGSFEVENEVTR
jgi:hypothetical protein